MLSIALGILVFAVVVVAGPQAYRDFRLRKYGIPTVGTVTSRDRENHDFVRYAFHASGTLFRGADNGCESGSNLVPVVFLPEDPNVSTCRPVGSWVVDVLVAGGFLVVAAIIIFAAARSYASRRTLYRR